MKRKIPMTKENEQLRIRDTYAKRDFSGKTSLYEWNRPDVIQKDVTKRLFTANLLSDTFGPDISAIRVLDVGCGTGSFLRLPA